jgi:hypothetical protein
MTVGRYGGDRPDRWIILEDFSEDEWKPPPWWRGLLSDRAFVQQLITRWFNLRTGVLSLSALLTLIDSWTALLDEAQIRNYERWPDVLSHPQGTEPFAFPTYAEEVDEFRVFLEARLNWVDSNIHRLKPPGETFSVRGLAHECLSLDPPLSLTQDILAGAMPPSLIARLRQIRDDCN